MWGPPGWRRHSLLLARFQCQFFLPCPLCTWEVTVSMQREKFRCKSLQLVLELDWKLDLRPRETAGSSGLHPGFCGLSGSLSHKVTENFVLSAFLTLSFPLWNLWSQFQNMHGRSQLQTDRAYKESHLPSHQSGARAEHTVWAQQLSQGAPFHDFSGKGVIRGAAPPSPGVWERQTSQLFESGSQPQTCRLTSKAPFAAVEQGSPAAVWLGTSSDAHVLVSSCSVPSLNVVELFTLSVEEVWQSHRARDSGLMDLLGGGCPSPTRGPFNGQSIGSS